jgi:hypothetical protein
MDEKILEEVCQTIYNQFPNMVGVKPIERSQPMGAILLIFEANATTEDGHILPISIRVVVDRNGKILKTTTSR